jgi:hypothetical protein
MQSPPSPTPFASVSTCASHFELCRVRTFLALVRCSPWTPCSGWTVWHDVRQHVCSHVCATNWLRCSLRRLFVLTRLRYDFPNWVGTPTCVAYASTVFHGDTSQKNANERFLGFETHVLQPLAQKYPSFQYTHTPLWGTLQAHGGSVGEPIPPPYPNVAFPSPEALMNDGCIHASKAGWSILMSALWDSYFAKRT